VNRQFVKIGMSFILFKRENFGVVVCKRDIELGFEIKGVEVLKFEKLIVNGGFVNIELGFLKLR
jgi:hypothetical protein